MPNNGIETDGKKPPRLMPAVTIPPQCIETCLADYTPATTIFQTFHQPQHLAYELFGFLGAGVRKNPNPGALFYP